MKILHFDATKKIRENAKALRDGKKDLTTQELSDIKLYLKEYKDCLETLQIFKGKIKEETVYSCFSENFEIELLEFLINRKEANISIVVVLSQKIVFFKKSDNCTINLCELAKILCDGECIEETTNLACGVLNETFLNFTKILVPC